MTAMQSLTLEQFRDALPAKLKKSVNPELLARINATLADPAFFEAYRDNLMGYTRVLAEGRFTIEQYLSAVQYVSYKLMGDTSIAAYSKTFPEKIVRFSEEGVASKDIASYVTAYNKSKLVNLIYEQTLIPVHVLNMDLYQKALNVQAELMQFAKSEKVRTDAANSLLTQLKPPETRKVELQVGIKEDSSIAALRESTIALARQQRALLQDGMLTAREAAHAQIIPANGDDIEDAVEVGSAQGSPPAPGAHAPLALPVGA